MRFGMWEIILILIIVLLLFGAKRIPELMRGLGSGVKEFKEGLDKGDEKKDSDKTIEADKPDKQ